MAGGQRLISWLHLCLTSKVVLNICTQHSWATTGPHPNWAGCHILAPQSEADVGCLRPFCVLFFLFYYFINYWAHYPIVECNTMDSHHHLGNYKFIIKFRRKLIQIHSTRTPYFVYQNTLVFLHFLIWLGNNVFTKWHNRALCPSNLIQFTEMKLTCYFFQIMLWRLYSRGGGSNYEGVAN